MAETEQFRVYEVADHTGAGVRVQLDYQPAPNLALATKGRGGGRRTGASGTG